MGRKTFDTVMRRVEQARLRAEWGVMAEGVGRKIKAKDIHAGLKNVVLAEVAMEEAAACHVLKHPCYSEEEAYCPPGQLILMKEKAFQVAKGYLDRVQETVETTNDENTGPFTYSDPSDVLKHKHILLGRMAVETGDYKGALCLLSAIDMRPFLAYTVTADAIIQASLTSKLMGIMGYYYKAIALECLGRFREAMEAYAAVYHFATSTGGTYEFTASIAYRTWTERAFRRYAFLALHIGEVRLAAYVFHHYLRRGYHQPPMSDLPLAATAATGTTPVALPVDPYHPTVSSTHIGDRGAAAAEDDDGDANDAEGVDGVTTTGTGVDADTGMARTAVPGMHWTYMLVFRTYLRLLQTHFRRTNYLYAFHHDTMMHGGVGAGGAGGRAGAWMGEEVVKGVMGDTSYPLLYDDFVARDRAILFEPFCPEEDILLCLLLLEALHPHVFTVDAVGQIQPYLQHLDFATSVYAMHGAYIHLLHMTRDAFQRTYGTKHMYRRLFLTLLAAGRYEEAYYAVTEYESMRVDGTTTPVAVHPATTSGPESDAERRAVGSMDYSPSHYVGSAGVHGKKESGGDGPVGKENGARRVLRVQLPAFTIPYYPTKTRAPSSSSRSSRRNATRRNGGGSGKAGAEEKGDSHGDDPFVLLCAARLCLSYLEKAEEGIRFGQKALSILDSSAMRHFPKRLDVEGMLEILEDQERAHQQHNESFQRSGAEGGMERGLGSSGGGASMGTKPPRVPAMLASSDEMLGGLGLNTKKPVTPRYRDRIPSLHRNVLPLLARCHHLLGIAYGQWARLADDVEVCRVRQMIAFYHLREGLHVPFENVNDVLLYDLAYLCAETRDLTTAQRYLRDSITLRNHSIHKWHLLALIKSANKDYFGALRVCDHSLQDIHAGNINMLITKARLIHITQGCAAAVSAMKTIFSVWSMGIGSITFQEPTSYHHTKEKGSKSRLVASPSSTLRGRQRRHSSASIPLVSPKGKSVPQRKQNVPTDRVSSSHDVRGRLNIQGFINNFPKSYEDYCIQIAKENLTTVRHVRSDIYFGGGRVTHSDKSERMESIGGQNYSNVSLPIGRSLGSKFRTRSQDSFGSVRDSLGDNEADPCLLEYYDNYQDYDQFSGGFVSRHVPSGSIPTNTTSNGQSSVLFRDVYICVGPSHSLVGGSAIPYGSSPGHRLTSSSSLPFPPDGDSTGDPQVGDTRSSTFSLHDLSRSNTLLESSIKPSTPTVTAANADVNSLPPQHGPRSRSSSTRAFSERKPSLRDLASSAASSSTEPQEYSSSAQSRKRREVPRRHLIRQSSVLNKSKDLSELWLLAGTFYLGLEQFEDAIYALTEAQRLHELSPNVQCLFAEYCLAQAEKNFEAAIRWYSQAYILEPRHLATLLGLGKTYLEYADVLEADYKAEKQQVSKLRETHRKTASIAQAVAIVDFGDDPGERVNDFLRNETIPNQPNATQTSTLPSQTHKNNTKKEPFDYESIEARNALDLAEHYLKCAVKVDPTVHNGWLLLGKVMEKRGLSDPTLISDHYFHALELESTSPIRTFDVVPRFL